MKEEQCEGVRRRRLSNCIAWREREKGRGRRKGKIETQRTKSGGGREMVEREREESKWAGKVL